jgi:dTDP-4-dehydrorhamnose 3,5-epimerase
MVILSVCEQAMPEIKLIRFGRFMDIRGYFAEPFRRSDVRNHALTPFLRDVEFVQSNESFSRAGTVRGLHFQWNPHMGKLVRTLHGRMIDLAMDIRKGSPTFGCIVVVDMPANSDRDFGEWIWVPPGFAHGNVFPEDSAIEYFCSAEYNPENEASISPMASDIDWSFASVALRRVFTDICSGDPLISDKDRNGLSLSLWQRDERSHNFPYSSGKT